MMLPTAPPRTVTALPRRFLLLLCPPVGDCTSSVESAVMTPLRAFVAVIGPILAMEDIDTPSLPISSLSSRSQWSSSTATRNLYNMFRRKMVALRDALLVVLVEVPLESILSAIFPVGAAASAEVETEAEAVVGSPTPSQLQEQHPPRSAFPLRPRFSHSWPL